ncbi:hypothetical protein [Dethiosulfatarculus sandiegensis]|uniref:Uncharacterized protein n=1 Tax=Dethiosulfatarculus sandiegensis TaxID=1429043 RepID=A0A0D2GA76_9BACT|nr:hypothetical protein [Dethiosulfatarculus sandiegensis]KIX11787.1 hypothetical protein X474_23025 [Dethiosulfatarculus sandiegensis]
MDKSSRFLIGAYKLAIGMAALTATVYFFFLDPSVGQFFWCFVAAPTFALVFSIAFAPLALLLGAVVGIASGILEN